MRFFARYVGRAASGQMKWMDAVAAKRRRPIEAPSGFICGQGPLEFQNGLQRAE
jgi:hypothetical protein